MIVKLRQGPIVRRTIVETKVETSEGKLELRTTQADAFKNQDVP